MSTLAWTRSKANATYNMGGQPRTVSHTTHTAALSNGEQVRITSIEGSFFVDIDGRRSVGLPYPTLREAKAAVQRREDATWRIDRNHNDDEKRTSTTFALPVATVTSETGVIYEPWTNGFAIGFKVIENGSVEYVYLNPSTESDDGASVVFLYHGVEGDPGIDGAASHIEMHMVEREDATS